jgi:hypothetical protein
MLTRALLQGCGVLVVLFGLREVFRDIFHPTRSGSLSDVVGWVASRLLRHTSLRPAVGPLALVSVILCWASTLVLGFALIYCGLTQGEAGAPPGAVVHGVWPRLLQSLYLSLGTFDTFQTFDLKPRTAWLKIIIAAEGFIGISMITASVSWLVLLYPALARMREFAKRVSVLVRAEQDSGLSLVRDLGAPALMELLRGVVQFRLDVILFPILLNFYATEKAATISQVLPGLCLLSEQALSVVLPPDVRLAGSALRIALQELADTLSERVVQESSGNMEDVFAAFEKRNH